jgi:probable rRNA maturation factor
VSGSKRVNVSVKVRRDRRPAAVNPAPSAPGPTVEVALANRHPRLRVNRAAVLKLFALLEQNRPAIVGRRTTGGRGELSVVFMTDAALARLHGDFLDDPTTTDVITFEGDPTLGSAGEICVSADTAAAYAHAQARDFSAELTLYLVHGWLHLAGHDDLAPAKKRAMRRAETRAMRAVTRAGAVPPFSLRPRG